MLSTRDLSKVLYPELSYKICGLCFEIHNKLGRFLNEKQYTDALEQLLIRDKVIYVRETALARSFEGEKARRNIPDFVIDNTVIVDLKAKRLITKDDYFQMRRYLASSNKRLGIIVNFRPKYLTPKRVAN
ncbi:MAG: hypothetical protein G01um10143_280 [Parcubacteria group bacterium Gr01-1014_3]|nr:MAG: hypothetical protein G01um10143_280 [Parcubacteria group bacterium Gr01-1014_3]